MKFIELKNIKNLTDIKKISVFALAAAMLSACAPQKTESDKLTVYTSFYAMYDFAKEIGGDKIELVSMVPTGSEPHDYEPSAKDMAKLHDADIFIYNGNGMEEWAKSVADTLPDTVEVICLSGNDGEEQSGGDPHTWLNIENAEDGFNRIYTAFAAADESNADYYRANYEKAAAETEELINEYNSAGLYGKTIYVTHAAYGYLCDEFGMKQVSLEGIYGDSDPTPSQLAKVVEEIKQSGAKCIFYDPLEGDKIAASAAEEANVSVSPLYTFEGDEENRSYAEVMRANLEILKGGIN